MTGKNILSFTRRVEPLTAWQLWASQPDLPRLYWAGQEDAVQFAGSGWLTIVSVGGTDRFAQAEQAVQTCLRKVSQLDENLPDRLCARMFGGFSFWDVVGGSRWNAFPTDWFGLPKYQLTQFEGETWLTVNLWVDGANAEALARDTSREIEALARAAFLQSNQKPTAVYTKDFEIDINESGWCKMLNAAQADMQAGHLEKVVLARTAHLSMAAAPDFSRVMQYLTENYPTCTRFLIEPKRGSVFFGASPETLVTVEQGDFSTVALAGSARRGTTPAEDARLGQALLTSTKNRHEHQLVVDMLFAQLSPVTSQLIIEPESKLRRLKNIQHLETSVQGTLLAELSAISLLERLHPTPALGGQPRQAALAYIRAAEPFERGWYAAPVGWVNTVGDGDFAVAIRSGLSIGNDVYLFAGAGIVAASDPEKEWQETGLKLNPLLEAFGVMSDG